MTTTASTIPVGTQHDPQPVALVRTAAQRDAVQAIIAADDFDFACNNPFTPAVEDYQGPFTLLWYDRSGALHGTRIAKRGHVLRETVVEATR